MIHLVLLQVNDSIQDLGGPLVIVDDVILEATVRCLSRLGVGV